jgi:hypothetical protein
MMCFFDQHRFACGDMKRGHFRQHCDHENRNGQPCGMKLYMQIYQLQQKCRKCEAMGRRPSHKNQTGPVTFGVPRGDPGREGVHSTESNSKVRELVKRFHIIDATSGMSISEISAWIDSIWGLPPFPPLSESLENPGQRRPDPLAFS